MRAVRDALGIEPKLERAVAAVENDILSILEGNLGQLRKSMKDLASQVEAGRKAALEWERSQWEDPKGVPKPRPADPERPTDAEVEREIVHQLYRKDCWGAKYGQYEALKRGYNSKAPESQVKKAVKALEGRGWLLPYPKSEEQYRLNPQQAAAIYRFLGVAERRIDALVDEARREEENPQVTFEELEKALEGYAWQAHVDRQVAELRRLIAGIEVAPASVSAEKAVPAEIKEVLGAIRGLQGEVNRLKAQAEAMEGRMRQFQAELKQARTPPAAAEARAGTSAGPVQNPT